MTEQAVDTVEAQIARFEAHTRQSLRDNVEAINYSANGSVSKPLPKFNYLSALHVFIRGTFKATHATTTSLTKSPFGPANLIKRLRVSVLEDVVVSLRGRDLFFLNIVQTLNSRADQTGDTDTFAHGNVVSSGGTTNTFRVYVRVPITQNDVRLLGLLLLQSEQTQANVEIDWDSLAADSGPYTDAATGAIAISNESITATVIPEMFTMPPEQSNRYPMRYMYQTQRDEIAFGQAGPVEWKPTRGNILTRAIMYHIHNNTLAPSSDIERIEISANGLQYPISIPGYALRSINREMYGRDLPQGCYVLDFNHQGVPGLGTARDYYNLGALTDFKVTNTVVAGATLGTVANLNVVKQVLVPIRGIGA